LEWDKYSKSIARKEISLNTKYPHLFIALIRKGSNSSFLEQHNILKRKNKLRISSKVRPYIETGLPHLLSYDS